MLASILLHHVHRITHKYVVEEVKSLTVNPRACTRYVCRANNKYISNHVYTHKHILISGSDMNGRR